MTKATKSDISSACESFLKDWKRHDWMQENGSWASEDWNDEREAFDEAQTELEDALKDALKAVESCTPRDDLSAAFEAIDEARSALSEAAEALDGEVRPDESDYIAEGLIDPDDVSGNADSLDVGSSWQGWDCKEGWSAYQVGEALYLNWWRNPYGGTNRHKRDLWVCVDESFFPEEEEEEEEEA